MTASEIEAALADFLGSAAKAKRILARTSLRHLAEAPPSELRRFLPEESARRFGAALRLARLALSPPAGPVLATPSAAYAHFYPLLAGREAERFVVAVCDVRFRALTTVIVAEGSPLGVDVRPVDVFAPAIRHRAVAVLCAHNHPSEDASPSDEDRELTRRLANVGLMIGIPLLDHLVVTGSAFRSALYGAVPDSDPPSYALGSGTRSGTGGRS